MPSVFWFRRDLRLADNPALLAACDESGEGGEGGVLPLFVVDPRLWDRCGAARRAYLRASLTALDESLGGRLVVRSGDPLDVLPAVAGEVSATAVHVAADFGPYGSRRDDRVAEALAAGSVDLTRTGSAYAVSPGRVRTREGGGYRVFTPFLRSWLEHGWRRPVAAPGPTTWLSAESEPLPEAEVPEGMRLPATGERAALERWQGFLTRLEGYAERDRPAVGATSGMSVHLKWGEIHPRTLLADLAHLADRDGPVGQVGECAAKLRTELCWREFYADVLHRRPDAAHANIRREFDAMEHDEPGEGLEAWREGRTGFPLVDAGMRELRATGTMHNRVRMVTASFLVKDLHHHWWHGAQHFMDLLVDGDLASNQLNWQWVAGCGTDAAPYFRIFNPDRQADTFDPGRDYILRWVPEVGTAAYPPPILDHAAERREALARLERITR